MVWIGTRHSSVLRASLCCHATSGHIRWHLDRKFYLPFPYSLWHERKETFAKQELATCRFTFLMYCSCRVWLLFQPHQTAASMFLCCCAIAQPPQELKINELAQEDAQSIHEQADSHYSSFPLQWCSCACMQSNCNMFKTSDTYSFNDADH